MDLEIPSPNRTFTLFPRYFVRFFNINRNRINKPKWNNVLEWESLFTISKTAEKNHCLIDAEIDSLLDINGLEFIDSGLNKASNTGWITIIVTVLSTENRVFKVIERNRSNLKSDR